MQKRITLSVDSKVYEEFQKFCEENDIIISKRVERLMKKEMEENEKMDIVCIGRHIFYWQSGFCFCCITFQSNAFYMEKLL